MKNKKNPPKKMTRAGKKLKRDQVDKALEKMIHLKEQGNKALDDLKAGVDKVIREVKNTAEKVTSDLS
jgi:hypothetical protein